MSPRRVLLFYRRGSMLATFVLEFHRQCSDSDSMLLLLLNLPSNTLVQRALRRNMPKEEQLAIHAV